LAGAEPEITVQLIQPYIYFMFLTFTYRLVQVLATFVSTSKTTVYRNGNNNPFKYKYFIF